MTEFLLPNELSSGGFSGVATITYYLFKIPMGLTIITLNVPLFILAGFKIGKEFFVIDTSKNYSDLTFYTIQHLSHSQQYIY